MNPIVGLGARDHVARQQQADVRVGAEGTMCELRIARTQDAIGRCVDAELGLQRGLHVDVREHAEAFLLERFGDLDDRVRERSVDRDIESVHALAPLPAVGDARQAMPRTGAGQSQG